MHHGEVSSLTPEFIHDNWVKAREEAVKTSSAGKPEHLHTKASSISNFPSMPPLEKHHGTVFEVAFVGELGYVNSISG